MSGRRIAIAAGGTGGHVFPALGLARALTGRGHAVHILTDRRGGAFESAAAGCVVHRVRAASPNRAGLAARLGALAQLALGTGDALRILRQCRIEAVVGFGGYPSVPGILAGAIRGLPAVLHEQNAVLGRANRWLARFADVVATSFETTRGSAGLRARLACTGNPVRAAVADLRDRAYQPPAGEADIRLWVFGGSLGARSLSETVPAAIALLPAGLRRRLRITQQCRDEDLPAVEAAYRDIGQPVETGRFFDDAPERLAAAHLVICRSGASTVAELAVIGRPAILIPWPQAMDDHQSGNAAALAAVGAAWQISEATLSPEGLAGVIRSLLDDPHALPQAARAARRFGIPDAGDRLADLVLQGIADRRNATAAGRSRPTASAGRRGSERRILS